VKFIFENHVLDSDLRELRRCDENGGPAAAGVRSAGSSGEEPRPTSSARTTSSLWVLGRPGSCRIRRSTSRNQRRSKTPSADNGQGRKTKLNPDHSTEGYSFFVGEVNEQPDNIQQNRGRRLETRFLNSHAAPLAASPTGPAIAVLPFDKHERRPGAGVFFPDRDQRGTIITAFVQIALVSS